MSLLFAVVTKSNILYPTSSIVFSVGDRAIFAHGNMRSSVATILIHVFGFHQIIENIPL